MHQALNTCMQHTKILHLRDTTPISPHIMNPTSVLWSVETDMLIFPHNIDRQGFFKQLQSICVKLEGNALDPFATAVLALLQHLHWWQLLDLQCARKRLSTETISLVEKL